MTIFTRYREYHGDKSSKTAPPSLQGQKKLLSWDFIAFRGCLRRKRVYEAIEGWIHLTFKGLELLTPFRKEEQSARKIYQERKVQKITSVNGEAKTAKFLISYFSYYNIVFFFYSAEETPLHIRVA